MIKRIAYCDRCGDQIEGDVRRIDTCLVLMDESDERTDSYQPLVEGQDRDYCPQCIEAIRQFAITGKQAEKEEEKPVKKRYKTEALFLLHQSGKSFDDISKETGISVSNVAKRIKAFEEGKNECDG